MTEVVGAGGGGKLSGKTLAVKDNVHIAGVPMSCGSHFLRGFVSSNTAPVVARILDAGPHRHIQQFALGEPSPLPSPPLLSPPFLKVGSPLDRLEGLGERCKLPQRGPAKNEFDAL